MTPPVRHIRSLLVANRGEIALRVMRSARALGIKTIAAFSDADSDAAFVRFADQAMRIGPAPARDSYLNIPALLTAAQAAGADAIHPGYGFLAENAGFARAVTNAGLIFVGPRAEAIEAMGDKIAAKELVARHGVPIVPGFLGRGTLATLKREASGVGFPLLIKAALGGGGKGMRIVRHPGALDEALAAAQGEAERMFGDGTLLIERFIEAARHVEVQIFGDRHGHVIHFGERDCTLQRRYQKIIEEAPAPGLTAELRAKITAAGVATGRAIGYDNAGTVEFVLAANGEFFFLELNARIQVEHPVTEVITGHDLVALQIRVAEGAPLPLRQEDVTFVGHALEARLYAEDPRHDFRAATGTVHELAWPTGIDGLRIDAAITSGSTVGIHYDSLLAKIIVHGATREEARRKMARALSQTVVHGLATNRDLLLALTLDETFATVAHDISYVAAFLARGGLPERTEAIRQRAAIVALMYESVAWERSWPGCAGFRNAADQAWSVALTDDVGTLRFNIRRILASGTWEIGGTQVRVVSLAHSLLTLEWSGARSTFTVTGIDNHIWVSDNDGTYSFAIGEPQSVAHEATAIGIAIAPMPGQILRIAKERGQLVKRGDLVVTVEAMKMEHRVTAAISGILKEIFVRAGTTVAAGEPLFEVAPEPSGHEA